MRYGISAIALITSIALPVPAYADDVPLESFLKEIKQTLVAVNESKDAKSLPPFKSATLNVSVVRKKDGGGKFKLFIIEFGANKSSEVTSAISITLIPPPKGTAVNVGSADISDTMTAAILDAGRAIEAANVGQPPLIAGEVKATLKFGVTTDGSGGIKFAIGPAELGASGGVAKTGNQEIVIVYGK